MPGSSHHEPYLSRATLRLFKPPVQALQLALTPHQQGGHEPGGPCGQELLRGDRSHIPRGHGWISRRERRDEAVPAPGYRGDELRRLRLIPEQPP